MLVPDWRQLSPTVAVVVIGLGVSVAAGASVVVALNPTVITGYLRPAAIVAQAAPTAPPIVATPRVTPTLLGFAQGAPTMTPPLQAVLGPTLVLEAAPTSTPTAQLIFAEAPTEVPLVQSSWDAVQPQLDDMWGNDSAGTLALLNEFHTRFPDFEPATSKLYVALLANAADLANQGAVDAAAVQLGHAIELSPERPEARAALENLTADAAPAAANSEPPPLPEPDTQDAASAAASRAAVNTASRPVASVASAPAPVRVAAPPPPVRAAPPPPVRAAPPVVRVDPTPTKVPFVPPGTP